MALRLVVVALAVFAAEAAQLRTSTQMQANPVRKVVNLLQAMQTKVKAEGEAEKELYEKFMCYCQNSGSSLDKSIADGEAKAGTLPAEIEEAEGKLKQTKADLKQAQVDRTAAKEAMAEATAIREKEAAAFASTKAEYDANIQAVVKATAAIERGMGGSFLQTPSGQALRNLVNNQQDLFQDVDMSDLEAFLQQGAEYAPQSGAITGILKQMGDTMAEDLADATKTEDEAIKAYKGLMEAKTKEVKALTEAVEAKTKLIGELGVEIVGMKEDLEDTAKGLLEDKKFKKELEKGCSTKTAEWEERSKVRAEELVALADTIKIINDDDALDLFKKTLPSASASSFMQVQVSAASMRERAVAEIRHALKKANKHSRSGLELLILSMANKKALNQGGFDKVIKMIDDMVAVLKEEQMDDDNKKEYCEEQFDLSDDKKKALERDVKDHKNAIATTKESIATVTEEIAALEKGIKDLDKEVAEATENRKKENAEFKELMASDTAAKELLAMAKNRLNKFYNPKLYKAPKKEEALVQVDDAPPPPPATWDAYAKKSEESTGVIAMVDMLIADLDKEMTVAKAEEKDAQADYEAMMEDSAEKRTVDSKALADKEQAKADMEVDLEASKAGKKASTKELMATLQYIQGLHSECDWLIEYFDVRKEARTDEIDSLVKAKAVLSGADYSLLETSSRRYLRRSA